jgi:hypothetical protein
MSLPRLGYILLLLFSYSASFAQTDSVVQSLQNLPQRYLSNIENKVDKYSSRITSKTERTLSKLALFEEKIRRLVEAASLETAARLFSPGALTFASALEKFKNGQAIIEGKKASYDSYIDQLNTSINYLNEKRELINTKLVQPVKNTQAKLTKLQEEQTQAEAIQQFIKERKQLLISQTIQYIGKSKYLQKISKENFYYIETLRNYKELFNDSKKAEQTALAILNKIPAFKNFVQEHSMLAQLFGSPSASSTPANLAGLQTRASVNAQIQSAISAGGPNAMASFQQNLQAAQSQLSQLKDKILKAGGNSSEMEMPDFKPQETKSKTFKQRLVFGTNIQTQKATNYFPNRSDLGLSLGYKLNDKSLIGIGGSISLGLGQGWNNIRISSQGIGLRSFIDYKLKKQFFVTGGFEMNYLSKPFGSLLIPPLGGGGATWQQSGLVGITKKIAVKTKWFKGTNLQLLYNLLANQNPGISKPVVFRVGYNF